MENKIIAKYKITYENGVIQFYNLISHNDFINVIKPTKDKIYDLEKENKFKPTIESNKLKEYLINTFSSNFFTTESPLFKALETGILVLPIGEYKCKLEKL